MGIFFNVAFADASAILVSLAAAVVAYFYYSYRYWDKKGVPYLKPRFPVGNLDSFLSQKTTFGPETKQWYDELKKQGHKFGGVWTYARPVFLPIDPEYVKDVLTKDFSYFIDRDVYVNEKDDPQSCHLFNIRSNGWKHLRHQLTPTFTSGKIKIMFHTMLGCSNPMIEALEEYATENRDIDIKEVLASFTTDVIGSCALGIECNSFSKTDAKFRMFGRRLFTKPGFFRKAQITLHAYFPELAKKLGFKAFRGQMVKFFSNIIAQAESYREENGITRPDFLQLLINLKNSTKSDEKPFTFDQIVANSALFFIAGFDTSSTTMNFALYGLAQNSEIQKRARDEIEKVLANHDGEITYESLKEMTYLEQVINEAQRIFPPVPSLARICVKDYKLRDTDIVIEKGTPVAISTLGMARDPEYFPEPEKFDPERFNPENTKRRHPYIHLPFGEGPRNCIGIRFGMMQVKIGLITILRKFKLSLSPNTKLPLTIDNKVFLMKTNETLYLRAETI